MKSAVDKLCKNAIYMYISYRQRMSMVISRPPVVSFSQPKNLSQQLCRPNFWILRKKPSRVNHAKAIAACSVPPLFLLAASPAPATEVHSIVATRVVLQCKVGCVCDNV